MIMTLRKGIALMQFTCLLAFAGPALAQAGSATSPAKPELRVEMGANPVAEDPAPLSADTPTPVAPAPVVEPTVPQPSVVAPTPAPVPEPEPEPVKPVKKKGPPDALKPGQYIFEKHDNYDGTLKIVAVLDIQRMYVYLDDKLIGFTTISAGKKGKETPTGRFPILQKNIDHKSNIYSNAPMPYMQRLTWDGIALHAGHIPGYAASHGCIRMPLPFAKALYGITKMGQEVVVLPDLYTKIPPKPIDPPPAVKPPVVTPPVVTPPATQPTTPPVVQPTIAPIY